jgi:hypothetical protein
VDPVDRYRELCTEQLSTPGVELRRTLRPDTLMIDDRMFAALMPDGRLMLTLPSERIDELVLMGDAERQVMHGRPMREWVLLSAAADWSSLADEARRAAAAKPAPRRR